MENYFLKFVLFLAFAALVSCNDFNSFDDPVDTDRVLAVPLFNTTTTLTDLLDGLGEETFVTVGPDDLITLNYKGNVASRVATDLFTFLTPVLVPLEDSVTTFPFDLPGTLDVTLMSIKSGMMSYTFTNDLNEKVDLTLSIPQLVKGGIPYVNQTTLDSVSTGNNEWVVQMEDLTDYELIGDNDNLVIEYEAFRESDGERIEFAANPAVAITDIEFSYIEGFWGTEPLDIERDTIEIEFFENWVQGDVFFENPKIEITVDNGFGFPVGSEVKELKILTVDGTEIDLESSFIDNGIDFDYPAINEVGEVKTTVFDFDKDNSNVVEVLSSGPVSVDYDVDALSNPDSIQELGFMTDSSFFNIQVGVELPFRGRVNNFQARDVFNVSFDSYDDVNFIEFKMVAENGLPLGIDIQVYFADENENLIDSLYTSEENILEAAPVDTNGDVTGVLAEKTTFATVDAEKFNKIRIAKKLIVEGLFFTTDVNDSAIVNLKSDQSVEIRMGMRVGLE
ncbi:MAG: hypothetical protein AAF573_09525 [Bacteroidota bacterium]